ERAWLRFSESSRATCVASAIRRADSRLVSAAIARSKDLKSSAVRITRPSRRLVSICCWTSWISARISARRSRGCCGAFSGSRRWLGLRLGMVVPLATGVSENDDYQRACGRRETPLQGTDSFGSLPNEYRVAVRRDRVPFGLWQIGCRCQAVASGGGSAHDLTPLAPAEGGVGRGA